MNLIEISNKTQLFLEIENFNLYSEEGLIFNQEHIKKFQIHIEKINIFFQFQQLNKKINYFYVSKNLIEEYAKNKNSTGRANLNEYSVVSIYPFHPHEITHVIIFANLGRSIPLLEEGIAVLFGRNINGEVIWKNKPISHYVEELKENNKFPNINELLDNFSKLNQDISYPASAYYVKVIIDKISIDKFKVLFKSKNRIEELKNLIM